MKQPVIIPHDLCGFDKLTREENNHLYNWYDATKKQALRNFDFSKYNDLALKRNHILDECKLQYGNDKAAYKKPFLQRCKNEIPEWAGLKNKYDSIMNHVNNELHKRVLEYTWTRGVTKDIQGKDILPAHEWMDMYKKLDSIQKLKLDMPYVKTIHSDRLPEFTVDAGIAENIKDIIEAGYTPIQSCSGLLEDHPNRRYTFDSSDNGETYTAGQPMHQTLYGAYAYLEFFKPGATAETNVKNTEKQINEIREIAEKNGWVTVDNTSLLQPSIRLELPMTYDGTSADDIVREADKRAEESFPGYKALRYPDKVQAIIPFIKNTAEKHGGIVPWTDALIKDKWNTLSVALKNQVQQAQEQNKELERISDIRLITKNDGSWAVKCKIDGEPQMMKDVNEKILNKLGDGKFINKEVCAALFKEELAANVALKNQVQQEQDKNKELARISDMKLINKNDGSWAVKCRIDGKQQMMKDVNEEILNKLGDGKFINKEVCAALFKEELAATTERTKGLKI